MTEQVKQHIRHSPEQWQGLIQSQQQSGLSASAFCEQQNIGYASFCNWRKRLSVNNNQQHDNRSAPKTDFIDLSTLPGSHPSGWQITLKLGEGLELSLSKG